MTDFKARSWQVMLGAAVLSLAGMAQAQVEQAKPAAEAAGVQAAKPAAQKHHHSKGHHHRHGDKAMSREDAAAKAEARRGRLDDGQSMSQYERNAFARCQVFKADIDRQACAERVRAGAASGSVKDGGILREATVEQVIR